MTFRLIEGDCVEAMAAMDEASVDAIVTDPPYGISFMGRTWDSVGGRAIDPAFLHWFAGFTDGEGCFSVHKKNVNGYETYDCQFSISLRADDRPILERIHRTLGIGTLSKSTAHRTGTDNPKARYSVSAKADLVVLRDIFRGFPLRAKKAHDFELWSDALSAWLEHEPGEWREMAETRAALMASREYAEEGIRVDPFQMWSWRWGREALRVLKPGGHLLAFGGTRTFHRLTCGLEDAGFEIRDCLSWLYGSGFPKSLDVSKAIDKAAGAEREVVGEREVWGLGAVRFGDKDTPVDGNTAIQVTAPATPEAQRWQGWGTALKPSWESIVWAVKPLAVSDVLATIGSQLGELEDVWQAREAEQTTPTGAAAGSSAPTATSRSGSTVGTDLSIVSSWKACWAELCDLTSTSTTATMTSATTDLRTLSSCLAALTDASTQASRSRKPTESSLVAAVDHLFGATVLSWRSTRVLSALGLATANTPHSLRDGAEPAPNWEPVILARKPTQGTVAANVTRYGTGAINVDGTRIGTADGHGGGARATSGFVDGYEHDGFTESTLGRWPANVVLDEAAAALLDEQSGETAGSDRVRHNGAFKSVAKGAETPRDSYGYADTGGASRFFHVIPTEDNEPWPSNGASTAATSSTRSSPADGSAPSVAATSDNPEAQPQPSATHSASTSAMPSGSKLSDENDTPAIPSIGPRSSQGSRPTSTEPTSPVNGAGILEPTDTTTTTASRSRSATSVGPATSDITSNSTAAGAKDSDDLTRFRYVAKADRAERERGVEHRRPQASAVRHMYDGLSDPRMDHEQARSQTANHHPTVKPVALMQWLVRMVTPPGGVVLDPFLGSGSTGIAALREGFEFIGIEREHDYVDIARDRIQGDAPLFNEEVVTQA